MLAALTFSSSSVHFWLIADISSGENTSTAQDNSESKDFTNVRQVLSDALPSSHIFFIFFSSLIRRSFFCSNARNILRASFGA